MAKLRERRQLRLSVPASPPPFPHLDHPFAALPSTPPGSPVLAELEMLSVIADFGASRVVTGRDEAHHQSPGTWAYMSPEKLHPEGFGGGGGADFSGDVWSLGVVLLECHAGRFPLVAAGERPDWPALVLAVCFAAAPEVPVAASPEFGGFVRRCLEKDWRRRATVEELLGHPFVAGKPSRCERQNEWRTTFQDKTGQVNTSIYGEE
uniref:Protein kinase domain-containing protein n=1 Tax=Oryza barthii TaxID=65489 RepID=A0A0D3F984_9ORYZ